MKRLLVLAGLLAFVFVHAQQNDQLVDSAKKRLSAAVTPSEKVNALGKLSLIFLNSNLAESDRYGLMMKEEAERSRDRKLIIQALRLNGQRYSLVGVSKDFVQKSIGYYEAALEVARQNKMDQSIAECLLDLASVDMQVPDLEKALNHTTEAGSIASTLRNDSLQAAVYNSLGDVYMARKQRLLSLRNYLNAQRIAEELNNSELLRDCYRNLMSFYSDIKAYDRAIDFGQKAMDQLSQMHKGNEQYNRVIDLFYIGNLYVLKKDFDMSVSYYEQSIRLADSLKYEPLKMPAYQGLLAQYMQAHQPQKALAYLNERPELKQFILNFGLGYVLDRFYAVIYRDLGKYDSAQYYFNRAAPSYETAGTPANRIEFYYQYAGFFKASGHEDKAIEYYEKARAIADATSNIDWQQEVAGQLDSAYALTGNYKESHHYAELFHQYKDSLQQLGAEKEMMQMELADEQQRQERKAHEEAAALEHRHYVEYTGIIIGIAVMFLVLVLMGAFRVSEGTIKVVGFFAFILLFEFIILIADTHIHHWTEGEPLKVLGIKIVLIALLLPFHHRIEHKVVSYLASRRMMIPSGRTIWKHVRRKVSKVEEH